MPRRRELTAPQGKGLTYRGLGETTVGPAVREGSSGLDSPVPSRTALSCQAVLEAAGHKAEEDGALSMWGRVLDTGHDHPQRIGWKGGLGTGSWERGGMWEGLQEAGAPELGGEG